MEQYDIIIIGAGPAGLYLASLLKQFKVLVLEEHAGLGKKACSGIVSANIEKFVKLDKSSVEWAMRGIDVISKRSRIRIEKEKPFLYVINREGFERNILRQLDKNKVLFGKKVVGIKIENEKVIVKTEKETYYAKLLIGCDGANSIAGRAIGQKPREIVSGLTATVSEPCRSEYAEVFIDKDVCKDGFLWKIPRGDKTEYGMLGKNVRFEMLENLFKIKNYQKSAAPLPIGPPEKTYSDRVLLVGDAAGQVKPWTGGGIVYSLAAAKAAAGIVSEAIERGDFSEEFLEKYEREWKKILGKNIRRGLFMRDVYKKMNNSEIEILMKLAKTIRNRIGKRDYDFPFSD